MNLQQIKADIKRHEVMACYDLQGAINTIDFVALADARTDDKAGYTVANGIATVAVRGLLVPSMDSDYSDWGITGYNHIASYIEQANADPMVTNIVLDVDSGGGYVAGIDVAAEAIHQSAKPIETFASGNMYSAAYWLGATARKVTATKSSGIGSIGVLIAHYEESKALEQQGITATFIRSGKWKAVFNSSEPLTGEQRERLQADVDEQASIFYSHVSAYRDIEPKVMAEWGGDTFSSQTAKDLGLIDSIANQPATYTSLQTHQMSLEDEMDLQAALAENTELKAKLSAKDDELAALKDAQRDTRISALAEKTGRTFSDDDIAKFKAMDDSSFEFAANFAESMAVVAKPELPQGMFGEMATQGAKTFNGDDLDAAISNLAKA